VKGRLPQVVITGGPSLSSLHIARYGAGVIGQAHSKMHRGPAAASVEGHDMTVVAELPVGGSDKPTPWLALVKPR
jgi:hypothetical protein